MKTAAVLLSSVIAVSLHADLAVYRSGNAADVKPPALHGPVLDLAGSGAEETGLQAFVDAVRGCATCDATVDVVVIRGSGEGGLNESFMALHGVDSSVSYVITDRDSAERKDLIDDIDHAEIVWFAGGDQCNYIRWVKGTSVQRAVERVYARGGGIGGNSAGLAIQGDEVYDACPDVSADSKTVLADPFSRDVSLSRDFFHWKYLGGFITDTHFKQRDRMGRTLVFLARILAERHVASFMAIGVSEGTSVIVQPDGSAKVFGAGPVNLIRADTPSQKLAAGVPLTHRGYKVWHFEKGATIDFTHLPKGGYRVVDVIDGKITSDPY